VEATATTAAPATAAPAAAAPAYRYVQVGMFNVPANATRAAATLRGLGLPGKVAKTTSGKTVVVAGPYDRVAALNEALATARRAFPDAFLRN
jgi:cell division protein FtsN